MSGSDIGLLITGLIVGLIFWQWDGIKNSEPFPKDIEEVIGIVVIIVASGLFIGLVIFGLIERFL